MKITVTVNGREYEFFPGPLVYEVVVRFAELDASRNPTVTHNKPQGTLTAGEWVEMVDGQVFNAAYTDGA